MNELCSLIVKNEAPKKKVNALERPKPKEVKTEKKFY
jgi:hypothetical protein